MLCFERREEWQAMGANAKGSWKGVIYESVESRIMSREAVEQVEEAVGDINNGQSAPWRMQEQRGTPPKRRTHLRPHKSLARRPKEASKRRRRRHQPARNPEPR